MKRLYIINGKYLGQSPVPPHLSWKFNLLWYCDSCGKVYARLPVTDTSDGPRAWQALVGVCGKCQPRPVLQHRCPGSIWDTSFSGEHQSFPKEVLQYELLLLIDDIEKEMENATTTV